jgi:hypothetical protein
MRKLIGILGLASATLLAGCGGGGGSPGDTPESYSISLVAAKTSLPLNTSNYPVGIGVNHPFTTTLYVNAKKGDAPIPGGEEIFACNTAYGLDSGPLYYLDGDDEHETEVDDGQGGKIKIPNAYRSITLGSNAGGNSFHFHAGDQAGTATITCSVHDPRANREVSASVTLTVGGGAGSGKAASIQGIAKHPDLGVQGNLTNLRTSTAISAYIWDDANQPVPTGGQANLQISIRPTGGAALGARLFAEGQTGSVLRVKSTGGVGLFSLSSGSQEGPILLEMTTDRADNDVTNGIQDPITGFLVVSAMQGMPSGTVPDPIEFVDISPEDATNGLPYSYILSAKGGVAPYTWAALGRLPDGLGLASSGLLSGTPSMDPPGKVSVAIRVTDSRGASQTANLTITVGAGATAPTPTPTPVPLSINLSGCGSNVNTTCELPGAPVGGLYQYVLTATGDGTGPVTWAFEPAAPGGDLAWLTLSASGILQGTVPSSCGPIGDPFFIKATKGGATTIRKVFIRGVTGPGGTC